jgi:hypothetical protein
MCGASHAPNRLTVGKVADGQQDYRLLACDHERGGFCRNDASGPSPVKVFADDVPSCFDAEAERGGVG